jgi:hypothetical protein
MLPGEVGHQNRVIVYHLDVSARAERLIFFFISITCVAQRSFPREHHSPTLFVHLDRVTGAVRFELGLQFRQRVPRRSESS